MNEHASLISLYRSLRSSGGTGVLATVVKTSGSTYRRAGARMLLAGDGRSAGLISGGCLESDLRERAAPLFSGAGPTLLTYDATTPGDILWGLGLGCPGIAYVFIERVSERDGFGALPWLEECRRERRAGALATLYALPAGSGERPGSYVPRARAEPGLERELADACARALEAERSSTERFALPGGNAEAFIEYLPPPVALAVFGAGPDAVPLVRLAGEMGWHVTVVDGRSAFLNRDFFPTADALLEAHPAQVESAYTVPPGAAAVVMTHNYESDVALLKTLLPSGAAYIGVLGPRSKTDMILRQIAEEGVVPGDREAARLHSPVGLDIGAETPEEIALAIIAEIMASLRERTGGSLRHRQGPIHR